MFKFIVQFFVMFVFWKTNSKSKGSWLTPSSFLIGIYMLSSLLAIPTLYIGEYSEPFSSDYWAPVFGFLFMVIMFLLPFKKFNETKLSCLKLPSREILDIFSSGLIVLSFFAIIFNMRTVVTVFTSGDLGRLRNSISGGDALLEEGVFNTIASVSSSLYIFAILFYFIYTILGDAPKRCKLLLMSSFSEPIHVLCFVGRDGIVFWLFSFIFLFLFFSPFMERSSSNKIKKTLKYIAIIMTLPFLLITFSRFGESDTGNLGSIISYLGQSFVNGPLFFAIEDKPYSNGKAFAFILSFFGVEFPIVPREFYQIGDWCSWTFGTFLVSWYRNMHLTGLVIACFSLYFIFKVALGFSRNNISLHHLFLYLLYYRLYSEGVFYFTLSGRGGNLFIIISFVLFFLFSFLERFENSISINTDKNKVV